MYISMNYEEKFIKLNKKWYQYFKWYYLLLNFFKIVDLTTRHVLSTKVINTSCYMYFPKGIYLNWTQFLHSNTEAT